MVADVRQDTVVNGPTCYSPNRKRAGEPLEDEIPSSKRQQRKDDRMEDKDLYSKRQQRLVRNRNSAALSRWRKRAGMEALEKRNAELERANARLNYLLASASMENQALRAALVERDVLDTVSGQGISAVGEPAVLSQCMSQPMYAEQLKKHNSLQLEYQRFPCATASRLRRPIRHVALLLLSFLHRQCCLFPGWFHAGDLASRGLCARVKRRYGGDRDTIIGGGISFRGSSLSRQLLETSRRANTFQRSKQMTSGVSRMTVAGRRRRRKRAYTKRW